MNYKIAGVIASTILLGGCAAPYSEVPQATNFNTTEQNKLQAGLHWKIIANDMAHSVSYRNGISKTIYVAEPTEKSSFNRAFHTLMISSLVNQGMKVTKLPSEANVTVELDMQLLKFSKDRTKNKVIGIPTLLTTGVWVLRDFIMNHSTASSAIVATGSAAIGMDTYEWFQSKYSDNEIPRNEILVTVNLIESNRYLSSLSNVYYTSDTDELLYGLNGKNIKVEGANK